MNLNVTELAETKLRGYLEASPEMLPKVAAQSGGCSGFKYFIGLDARQPDDTELILSSGLVILIPEESIPYLDGVTLDYKESLMDAGFFFQNPNASSCGCGSSFRPRDSEACE